MASINAKRDNNRNEVSLAKVYGTEEYGPIKIDPATDRVILDIQTVSEEELAERRQLIDANRHHSAIAVEYETSDISAGQPLGLLQALTYATNTAGAGDGSLHPILIDAETDRIWVHLIDETPRIPAPPTGTPIGLLLSLTYQV